MTETTSPHPGKGLRGAFGRSGRHRKSLNPKLLRRSPSGALAFAGIAAVAAAA